MGMIGLRRFGIALALAAAPGTGMAASLPVTGGRIAVPTPGPDGITRFRGIPYAAAPTGAMRWRAPGAIVPWRGVRPADRFAADCMQAPSDASPAERPRAEDCLYLNVWSGPRTAAAKPVFVWIHGGGSRVGSGAQPEFDGTALARQGIVVVTINYRLGPLGFLSTPALSAESGRGASGNQGFLDQIAALRWVQKNIATFGGDPTRVTIGGESSGSVSTGTLMASPLAHGLFHQAIGESGSVFRVAEFGSMGATDLTHEEAKGARLMAALKAPDLATMRAAPAEAVLAAAQSTGTFYNLPVVDGYVLPDAPLRVFEARRHNDVALLVGWNSDEGSLQAMGPLAALPELLQRYYGAAGADIASFYRDGGSYALYPSTIAAGDNGIAYASWRWGVAQTQFGRKPVYLYEFDRAPPLPAGAFGPNFDVARAGAYHGAEIPYVFDTLATKPRWAVTADDRRIAGQMSGYWANFIRTGTPNGAGLPAWPAYDTADPKRMQIGLRTGAAPDPAFAKFKAIQAAHERIDPPLPAPPAR